MFLQIDKDGQRLWIEVVGIQGEVCEITASDERHRVGMVMDVPAPDIVDVKF